MSTFLYGLLESNSNFVFDAEGTGIYTLCLFVSIITPVIIAGIYYKLFDSYQYANFLSWLVGLIISSIIVYLFTSQYSISNMKENYDYPYSQYALIGITSMIINLIIYTISSLMKYTSKSLKNTPI